MDLLNYLRSKNIFIDKGFVKRSFYWTTFCKQLLTKTLDSVEKKKRRGPLLSLRSRGGYDCREVSDFPCFLGVVYCGGVQLV